MPIARCLAAPRTPRTGPWLVLLTALAAGAGPPAASTGSAPGPFEAFDLPDEWQQRFWSSPGARALLDRDAKSLAKLVPVQAGLRHCRCPGCDASELEHPLAWDAAKPDVLTCRKCRLAVPSDKFPAKVDGKVPEDTVEVLPHVVHHYPYHTLEPEKQRYPDERLYLAAKRDFEAREFLAKAALYAALRYHKQPPATKDPRLIRLACVLLVRFAQVYPAYATHYDQPGQPKFLQQANLPPPYRRGYRTAKWDWTGSLDVPLNLVIAYAFVRGEPALAEAGRLLDEPNPALIIERDLFRASAEFVRAQPEEYDENSLQAYRGLLAVGQLLGDPALIDEAEARFAAFAERGFYHDGFWRQGDVIAHRRVLGMIDGWINRLVVGESAGGSGSLAIVPGTLSGAAEPPMLALARAADSAILTDPRSPEIQQAAWPAPTVHAPDRRPVLLGGAGVARLAVGQGADALDLELRGQDSLITPHFQRLAIRLAVGGQPVLDDLDEFPPSPSGWDRATASHNTVVVDGLNQRESLAKATAPALGGRFLFFAADPDFQVVTLDDPRAYPQSTTRYRQTLVVASGAKSRYAASVFEVHGGLQHDQVFHVSAGSKARWETSIPLAPGPASLLPPSIVFVPTARAEDGRWFVQAYGEFAPLGQGRSTEPSQAWLSSPGGRGVRLHLLGNAPLSLLTALSPDPVSAAPRGPRDGVGRAGLILRRRSENGATLQSTFVTLFEPIGSGPTLRRVGRVATDAEAVVLYVETAEGSEHVVVNLAPGTEQRVTLADGRPLRTDGLVVRVTEGGLALAGGTFVECSNLVVRQHPAAGRIRAAVRQPSASSRGWFESDAPLADPDTLSGRTLLVRHGDDTTRGWTIQHVENTPRGSRIFVVEEPGFQIDPTSQEARYYQFPRLAAPGPHRFRVSKIAR